MSSRPSSFKTGGGFLNGTTGNIVGYEFTDTFPGSDGKKASKSDFNPLYCVWSIREDSADEDVTTTQFVGSADDFEIEDDGHTLTPVEDGNALRGNTEFAEFVVSAVDAGFPESLLPEDRINYESLIGTRAQFGQKPTIDRKTGKPKTRIAKKGKFKGKEFPVTSTIVTKVIALPSEGKSKNKPSTKTSSKPASKKQQADDDDMDVAARALEVLTSILEANDGSIAKAKLPLAITKAISKDPNKDEIRKLIYDDDQLATWAEEGAITYDASSKKQLIELAEAA